MSSISLPDDSSFSWFRSKAKSSLVSPIQIAMPRSTTPAPAEKERIRKDSTSSSVKAMPGRVISERMRTNSMSSTTSSQGMPKSILKKTSALPTAKPDIPPQSTQYIPIPPKNLRQAPSSVPTAAAGQFRPSSISMPPAPRDERDRLIHPLQRHASYTDKPVKSSAKPVSSSYYKKSGCLTDDESYSSASSMYHRASASARSKKSMSDDEGGYPTALHFQTSSSTSSSSASLASAHQQKKRYSHSQSMNKATSDYVLVSSAPLKEEAISLSWPLVDNISLSSSPTSSSAYRKRHAHSQGQHVLYFDIGFDPRYDMNVRIYRGGVYTRMTTEEGDIPASSHCTIDKMTIVCKELSRWPIVVSSTSSRGVRCMDVFYAIYKTLHEPLTSRERREFDKDFLAKCHSSFEQRCRDSPGLVEYNKHQGLRRVDLLRGNRIFQGLKQDGKDWVLVIYKP